MYKYGKALLKDMRRFGYIEEYIMFMDGKSHYYKG